MSALVLRSVDPARKRYREYAVSIQPGLFGDWCLMTHWGRIGATGQQRRYWFETAEEAEAQQRRILQRRERNGYTITGRQA